MSFFTMNVLIVLTVLFFHLVLSDKSNVNPNTAQIIANHDYPSETHQVITDDGYILTLFRIPHGIKDDSTTKRPPVLLMHGFGSCAAVFVASGPERGLGFILADAGYDVWLGNVRGTIPSRNHTSIDVNVNPEKYFNFTWHEIGYYDVASFIDYVLETNGDNSLHYVGHSQGTTVFLVLTSMRPEYNDKIKEANLMAPAAIIKHCPNVVLKDIVKYLDDIWTLFQRYKLYENPFVKPQDIVNLDIFSVHCPSTAGLKQHIHFGQLIRDGGFRQFDYGRDKNLEFYGTESPPDYDLKKITVPVALFYAQNDGLIAVEDEQALAAMIPSLITNYKVPDESFVHGSFVNDNNVVELVYNKLMDIMLQYKTQPLV